jgi:hypothetical protein
VFDRGVYARGTLIAEKTDAAGRQVRQIELCPLHCDVVIERERKRGLEISDRRSKVSPAFFPRPRPDGAQAMCDSVTNQARFGCTRRLRG